jgi:hypothetical protein
MAAIKSSRTVHSRFQFLFIPELLPPAIPKSRARRGTPITLNACWIQESWACVIGMSRHRLSRYAREIIHPRTSSTSPFFPAALRHRIPVHHSGPEIHRHGWTSDEPRVELEECSVTVQRPHAGQPPLAPDGTLRSPRSRLGPPAKLQSPRWDGPERNPLVREEECQSLSPAPAWNEEWKLFSDQMQSSVPWADHP